MTRSAPGWIAAAVLVAGGLLVALRREPHAVPAGAREVPPARPPRLEVPDPVRLETWEIGTESRGEEAEVPVPPPSPPRVGATERHPDRSSSAEPRSAPGNAELVLLETWRSGDGRSRWAVLRADEAARARGLASGREVELGLRDGDGRDPETFDVEGNDGRLSWTGRLQARSIVVRPDAGAERLARVAGVLDRWSEVAWGGGRASTVADDPGAIVWTAATSAAGATGVDVPGAEAALLAWLAADLAARARDAGAGAAPYRILPAGSSGRLRLRADESPR